MPNSRVLFIGGPKHGEHMDLPIGDDRYELITGNILSGIDYSKHDSRYQGNVYTYDAGLSASMRPVDGAKRRVFIHNVIGGPDHGADILPKMVKALVAAEAAEKALQAKQRIVNDRNREIAEVDAEAASLAAKVKEQDEALRNVRIFVERIAGDAVALSLATGKDYTSFVQRRDD